MVRFQRPAGFTGLAVAVLVAVALGSYTLTRTIGSQAEALPRGPNPFSNAQAEATGAIPIVSGQIDPHVTLSVPAIARGTITLRAAATPARPGSTVVFQMREGSAWRTVARGIQESDGTATTIWRPSISGIFSVRSATPSTIDVPATVSAPVNTALLATGARVIRWREWIEPGLGGNAEFIAKLRATFIDARGWGALGTVTFRYVESGPVDLMAKLATPKTTDRLCAPADTRGKWSCHANRSIVINSTRWFEGSPTLDLSIDDYRTLVVNHETGHALGLAHAGCPGRGEAAPAMMQQSKGLDGCRPNPWPLARERSRV